MKKKIISITISEDVLKKIKEKCKKENRNLSNYIETLMVKEIK